MQLVHVQPGMTLAYDVFDHRGNLLLEKGITLTAAYIGRLKQLGVTSVRIADKYADSLRQPVINEELREELTLCFRALLTMRADDLANQKLQLMYLEQIGTVMDKVMDDTQRRFPHILNVQIRQPLEDEIQHGINVCLLSLVTGFYLKLQQPLLKDLALGALFHDLGKTVVPFDDIDPVNTLVFHPLFGRELLVKSKFGPTVARIAAEHHEAFDGSGYPMKLSGNALHPLSRIVIIANYYDTALAKAEADGTPRQELVEKMMAQGNTMFDLNLLRAFFNTVAVFPVGSLVQLNLNKTAYVVKNNFHSPLRPVVRIVENGRAEDLDLVLRPNITINNLLNE